ncbi:uncharacterized protein DDB_G0283357-like [Teleopsis dalmanni]|uniref:uncharacterized protein DDB_G0283357-like n=1 Tax=Teleopsis dalmanni TaxID=139649 RepID=UPI0018CD4066|nr:uncharacterized protein DDB_G0283357-like [Teleopsis dalmanni]
MPKMEKVKIWFQNRRTKWKKQDNVTNSEAAEHKSTNSVKPSSANENGKSQNQATGNSAVANSTTSAPTEMSTKKSHNNNNNNNTEKNRAITNETSTKLTTKHGTKIKKQLNALLEKTAKNSHKGTVGANEISNVSGGVGVGVGAGVGSGGCGNGGSNITSATTVTMGKSSTINAKSNNEHNHQQHQLHHQHAIPLTVEPAAPLEQTEKLEIKLEESPQHRELQLSLLRAANNQSPLFSEMDFESKLAASKISNALAFAKLQNGNKTQKSNQEATTTKQSLNMNEAQADEDNKQQKIEKMDVDILNDDLDENELNGRKTDAKDADAENNENHEIDEDEFMQNI